MTKKEMISAILDKADIADKSYIKCQSRMNCISKEDIARIFGYVREGSISANHIVSIVIGIYPKAV